jgi:hypothetical protein
MNKIVLQSMKRGDHSENLDVCRRIILKLFSVMRSMSNKNLGCTLRIPTGVPVTLSEV